MADEIQLKVSADIKEVNSAITATKKFEKQITNTVKALNDGKITNKAYNQSLLEIKRGYQEYSTSSQKATADVRKMANAIKEAENAAKQQELAKAAIKNTQELNRLKMGYDKVYAAEQKRLRLKKLLRAEVAAGNMTLREAGRELLLYRQRLHETSQGFQFAKNKANKFGMVAQQVGYQVGDFFVQVQSGTSALVAFGQQGTQLAGLLPGVAGAVVGIGLSLGTMLLKTFLDTKDAGKQLEESVKAVGEALDDLSSTTSMLESTLGAPISAATERLQNYLLLLKKAKSQETFKEVSISFNQLLKEIGTGAEKLEEGSFMQKFILGTKFGPSKEDLSNAEYLLKVQGELAEVIKGTPQQPRIVQTSADIAALGDDLLAFSEKHGDVMKERIEGVLLETGLIQLMADELSTLADDQAKAGDEHNDQVKATNANLDAQLELLMKQYEEQLKIDAIANKTLDTLINQEQLIELQLKHGNDSVQVEQKKAEMARAAFEEALEKQGVEDEILTTIMLQYDTVQSLLASNKKLTTEKAAQLALDQRSLSISGQQRTGTLTLYGGRGAMTPAQKALEERNTEEDKKTRAAKLTTMEGPIKALERQIELSKALFGLEDHARRKEEVYMQLKFQNQDADIKASEKELRSLAERVALEEQRTKVLEEQNKVIEEQRQAQESLADSIAGSMGDAFTSIVDGTMSVKDAFKSMARAIIKELYEVLVVQQLVGSAKAGSRSGIAGGIMDFFGSANGNAMYGGNVIPFASGGVVGSPTTFPMSAGRTGLMGEAGPEAIMPLKRGANGKLGVQAEGGAGDVVIHQNFNFAANGDESVKKLIAQAAPQIANMTKSSIISDRRRGGQMKATFG